MRILLTVTMTASVSTLVTGTPSAAKWRRDVLLGANDSLFATLVYAWDQPGSYYLKSDTVFFNLLKNEDGSVVLRKTLWTTVHRTDVNTMVRSVERDSIGRLELNSFFEEYDLVPVPPYARVSERWGVDSTGLYIVEEETFRETILSMKELLSKLPDLSNTEFVDLPRVSGLYALGEKYLYVMLAVGYPYDVPCFEEVLLLDSEKLKEARRRIRDRKDSPIR